MKWTKEDIQGQFDFEFDIQSLRFMSQSRVQQIINALNILAAHSQSIPAFKEALDELDGKLVIKELFNQMDLNIEQFKKRPDVTHLELDPMQENELAERGNVIPEPRPLEPHREHLEYHLPKIEEMRVLGKNTAELERHSQMHGFLEGILSGKVKPQQIQQELGQQQPGQSPGFQEAAGPARTEPEVANNFFSNQNQGALG